MKGRIRLRHYILKMLRGLSSWLTTTTKTKSERLGIIKARDENRTRF